LEQATAVDVWIDGAWFFSDGCPEAEVGLEEEVVIVLEEVVVVVVSLPFIEDVCAANTIPPSSTQILRSPWSSMDGMVIVVEMCNSSWTDNPRDADVSGRWNN
jgi:hypothetical protein